MNIDGDFPSKKGNCKYHCLPTCHPLQIGDIWRYGCTHKAWPQNKWGDFVPIVNCGGETIKCEITKKWASYYMRGKRQSYNYTVAKAERLKKEMEEFENLKNQNNDARTEKTADH